MRETPTRTYYWHQFHSQSVARQNGCHGDIVVCVCAGVCVLHQRYEYAVKHGSLDICV